jgi:hypothetical protein
MTFMPHRPCAVQCIWRGGVVARTRKNTYRQYNCRKCNALVFIGRCCDHGNIYCKKHSRQAHLEAGRRRSATYQGTRQGKFNHAARMKCLRYEKKRESDQVLTAEDAARRMQERLLRHRRRGKGGRCQKTHRQHVRRLRSCAQKGTPQLARCPQAQRCPREHAHHECHGRSRAHRPPTPCRKTRRRLTPCRTTPNPTRSGDRTADKPDIVTHAGCTGTELGPKLTRSTPSQEVRSDGSQTQPVKSRPISPGIRCSFCGRPLPPLARLQTWRGSG